MRRKLINTGKGPWRAGFSPRGDLSPLAALQAAALLSMLTCMTWSRAPAASIKAPAFAARRDYVSGYSNHAATVGDTNGDGVPDLLQPSPPSVSVLFGNGNGTFRSGPTSSIGIYGAPTVVTDLNGDGIVDLAVAGELTSGGHIGLGVSFGNGNGTFQTAVFYQAGTDSQAGGIVIGDFNADGIPDAVMVGESGLWLFTGKGGGAFNPPVLTPFTGARVSDLDLAMGDFNGDGKLDLVSVTPTGLAVFFGNGNGTFQPVETITTPAEPGWIATGDVNLDGRADIVVTFDFSAYVSLYMGTTSGGFTGLTHVYLPGAYQIAIGDVNGDGIPDLVNSSVYIALGKGNGTFGEPAYHAVESAQGTYNAALADLRNDGLTDIVVQGAPGGTVSVLLALGKGRFEDGEWTPVTGGAGCGAVADYNGDGKPDLAVNTPSGVTVLLGTGKAGSPFTTGTNISLPGAACLVTGDLNGDGIPDLLVPASTASGSVVNAYLGNGDGTFTLKSSTAVTLPGYLALADFNNDGKLDFASSGNLLALGNGDGTFQAPAALVATPPYGNFEGIAAGDINGDGWPDLALTATSVFEVYVLLNNRQGGFTQNVLDSGLDSYPSQVLLAKLSHTGDMDMIFTNTSGAAYVYLGNGKGGFTLSQTLGQYPVDLPATIMAADVNGDGIPDISLVQASTIGIYLGEGNGKLAAPFDIGAGPSPGSIYAANLRGQSPSTGLPDIAIPDFSGGVTVLINTTK